MILKLTLLALLVSTAVARWRGSCTRTGKTFTDASQCIRCTCTANGYFDCRSMCEDKFPFAKDPPSNLARILRKRYNTPPPLTTTTKGTTNSPPPFTTKAPPQPGTTDGPTSPVTHGAATVNHHTRSPPPPKSVLG